MTGEAVTVEEKVRVVVTMQGLTVFVMNLAQFAEAEAEFDDAGLTRIAARRQMSASHKMLDTRALMLLWGAAMTEDAKLAPASRAYHLMLTLRGMF